MEKFAFTDGKIAKLVLPDGKIEQYFYDLKSPGLAVRVRPAGKAFVYFARGGRQRITIGKVGRLRVDQAREAAAVYAGDIAKHGVATTVVKKKQAKEAIRAKVSLGSLIGEADGPPSPYEKYLVGRSVVNAPVAMSALRRGLAKHVNDDIKSLGRRDYMACFDAIADAGKIGAAKDCRKHTYQFLRWCEEDKGYIDHNPLLGYKERKRTRVEMLKETRRRGRRLTDDEIKAVWAACGKLGAFGLLVRMCLLTGARRSEPASMQWQKHVSADHIIVVEDETAKMGRTHIVPRTAMIDQVLDDARHFQRATTDYVFPSNKTGREMSGFTKMVARLIREAGVQKFTLHDLRRTLRSIMADCGITSNDLQRICVGQQAEKKLDQIYNLSKLWTVRKMIFDHVHDHIANLVGGPKSENVVRLFKNPVEHELLKRLADAEVA